MSDIRIKRGETLNLLFWFYHNDSPMDVGQAVLASQVRAADGTLVAALALVKQPTIGLVTATCADTSNWPVGRLRADLKAVAAGQASITETFAIVVMPQVTQ